MIKEIYIVTRNKGKILAAKNAFKKYGIGIKQIEKDYPEIQSDTSVEIAKHTALTASKEFNVPVVREDHSLFINELGIPGPYTSFIEKKIPAEKLIRLLKEDFSGFFEIAAVYAEPNGFTKEFVYRVPIIISKELRGERGNWDRVLMLKGTNETFAESAEENRINVWNKNYIEIAKYLLKKNEK